MSRIMLTLRKRCATGASCSITRAAIRTLCPALRGCRGEEVVGLESSVRDPYAPTANVANQLLVPHQQAFIDSAREGPLAALRARC